MESWSRWMPVTLVVIGAVALLAMGAAADLVADGKPAPEIAAGEWINSPPLTLERLRGRVVLVEFWTYG